MQHARIERKNNTIKQEMVGDERREEVTGSLNIVTRSAGCAMTVLSMMDFSTFGIYSMVIMR